MKEFLRKIIYKLTYVIPKDEKLHVYMPSHAKTLSGNIKAQILYARKNHPEIKSVLLSRNKNIVEAASKIGLHAVHHNLLIHWYKFRAKIIFVDTTDRTLGYGRFRFVQLWHGAGFKYVGILWEKEGKSSGKRREIYKDIYNRCLLVAATSESNRIIQNRSFLTYKAAVTGYPRNDVFFENDANGQELKAMCNLDQFSKIITYAPTFRDQETQRPFSQEFWKNLNDLLRTKNEVFLITKHPFDRTLEVPNGFSNIKEVTEIIPDTQELLMITDVLITDYSSIATDFAITNRPILIYAYDFEEYIKTCRGMAYNLEEILPKPFVKTEEGLFKALENRDWTDCPEVKESYRNFKKMFHFYFDGHSSRRIMEKVVHL